MNNQNIDIRDFAENLWTYIKPKIEELSSTSVRFYRATVQAAAANGTISVQRPFDSSAILLPYVSSASSLQAGDQCVVLVLGSASNEIILGDGRLTNL